MSRLCVLSNSEFCEVRIEAFRSIIDRTPYTGLNYLINYKLSYIWQRFTLLDSALEDVPCSHKGHADKLQKT